MFTASYCIDMTNATQTPGEKLQTIQAKIAKAESMNRSASTMNRLFRELFAAEDAAKVSGWAR